MGITAVVGSVLNSQPTQTVTLTPAIGTTRTAYAWHGIDSVKTHHIAALTTPQTLKILLRRDDSE